MFNDPVSFNGGTRVEVITVLANCGRDTDRARRALVTWIRHKQDKNRSTEHILAKLRDIESKFIKDTSLHSAFRDARAETFLPRAPDLPLPASLRRSLEFRVPDSAPPIMTSMPHNTSPSSSAHPSIGSQILDISPGAPNMNRRTSLPQAISHVPHFRSPRIQIPRNRSFQHVPDSPIASSPEESGPHFRYRYMSQPVGLSSHFHGLPTPPSSSPPELPLSPISPRTQISRTRSQRTIPSSVLTSSSEESVFHPKYRHMSMSPSRRRVTPPATCPPDVPLPPIPSDDQGAVSDNGRSKEIMLAEQPPTPGRSPSWYESTPIRPLPMQPIPSPVPDPDEAEHMDTISETSIRHIWRDSIGDGISSEEVVRQDSPVFVFEDNHTIPSGIGPPPPYAGQLCTHFPPDMATFGVLLERAMNDCGASLEVRLVVAKCIGFHRGYEPPYWQSQLQASGLGAAAAKYLVDAMCKQVDWSTSFGRAI